MTRALALSCLVGIAFAVVALRRSSRPCPDRPALDDTDNLGDYGPLPDGFRIGTIANWVH